MYRISGLLLALIFILSGCATPSTSTGIMTQTNDAALPPGVPKRVGVIFSGQTPINIQSADQFASSLTGLGFYVVERNHIDSILKEYSLSSSGYLSGETAVKIGKLIGVEGLFVGSVTGESSVSWIDTHLNVKLVDINNGRIIWAANVNDPRTFTLSMDVTTSIIHTTKHAIKLLENDLLK